MRKLYLHVGCGKTGSSALQVWFNQNSKKFSRAGIFYPTHDQKIENAYEITSGNGVFAYQEIIKGNFSGYLKEISGVTRRDILLSSEIFQLLDENKIRSIKDDAESLGFSVIVVAYVRDLYHILTSMHHQFVKRHLYFKDFSQFVDELKGIQQFDVVDLWSKVFSDVRVVHYDSIISDLGAAFLTAIDRNPDAVPVIGKQKVNRSLTHLELEIVRLCNQLYSNRVSTPNEAFSACLSNALIAAEPEREAPVAIDRGIEEKLLRRFASKLEEFNNRYFSGEPRLAVTRVTEDNAIVSDPVQNVADELKIALKAVFEYADFSKDEIRPKSAPENNPPLEITDPRIVDVLRRDAIRRESFDLDFSVTLMKAAHKLRPTGPVINQKLQEYELLIKNRRDAP